MKDLIEFTSNWIDSPNVKHPETTETARVLYELLKEDWRYDENVRNAIMDVSDFPAWFDFDEIDLEVMDMLAPQAQKLQKIFEKHLT